MQCPPVYLSVQLQQRCNTCELQAHVLHSTLQEWLLLDSICELLFVLAKVCKKCRNVAMQLLIRCPKMPACSSCRGWYCCRPARAQKL